MHSVDRTRNFVLLNQVIHKEKVGLAEGGGGGGGGKLTNKSIVQ